jgi:hypothetical protein
MGQGIAWRQDMGHEARPVVLQSLLAAKAVAAQKSPEITGTKNRGMAEAIPQGESDSRANRVAVYLAHQKL